MKICILIVTFNRKKLLLRCVRKCLSQNIPHDILIYDNNSTDGTYEYLTESGVLNNSNVYYFKSERNQGGAGGFSNGLRMAYEKKYDYVWMMDDDGYPASHESLKQCLNISKQYNNPNAIVNSLVVGDDFNILSFKTGGFKTKQDILNYYSDGIFEGKISPFNGTLISKEIIRLIGFPRFDFFIKGDETEYSLRAVKYGIKLVTATNSMFYHPIMPSNLRKILFLTVEIGEESYWKEYYRARNYVFIYREYFSFQQCLKHILNCFIKVLLSKEDKFRKSKYVLKGLLDGYMGKFENIDF